MEVTMTIGEIITTARKRAGLTLRELSDVVIKEDGKPISISYLNDVEHDRRPPPSPRLLRQIADKLHLSYEYLVFLSGELPEDLRQGEHSPEAIEAAFAAFRKSLQDQEGLGE